MIVTWSQGIADENMPEEILVELAGLIRRHPWWDARAQLTLALLESLDVRPPARVLDAGCGWGVTLDKLEAHGYRADGTDISRRTLEALDRPGRLLAEADLSRPLPEGIEPYDAVLALDVIEHIDDDRAVVEHLGTLVRPGGVAIVSVPALPELFTEFDTIQGHRRRYRPETLRAAFNGTGFHVEKLFFWGAWMVPVLKLQRRRPGTTSDGRSAVLTYRDYLRLPPWPGPLIMRLAYALEQRRAIGGKLRTGTSLFAVARRTEGCP